MKSREPPQYLLLEEAAAIARAPLATVRYWISTGKLRARRPGRRVLILRSDLLTFIDAAMVQPADCEGTRRR